MPFAESYGDQVGCILKSTPAWAFNGELNTVINYRLVVQTVSAINCTGGAEAAKVGPLKGLGHNEIQDSILTLSGLGGGLSNYDIYLRLDVATQNLLKARNASLLFDYVG